MHSPVPFRPVLIAAALAALAAGCRQTRSILGQRARTPAEQAAAIEGNMRNDADILGALHQSNLAEIDAGRVAERRAADEQARTFGRTMVEDHTALDRAGSALATRIGVTPNTGDNTIPQLARRELDDLNSAGGRFDRVYIQHQVDDHLRTLNIVDDAIRKASATELKTALTGEVRPVIARHLARAQEIQSRIGTP